MSTSSLYATNVPQNLGYGLDKLVESRALMRSGGSGEFGGYATQTAQYYGERAITEADSGRVLIDISLTGYVKIGDLQAALLAKFPSFTITATDASYRGTGMIEGFIDVDHAAALSQTKGVRGVFLALKPDLESVPTTHEQSDIASAASTAASPEAPNVAPGGVLNKLGTAFDQGVVQHRVDQINTFYNPSAPVNYDGAGISVGAMSDSFDTRAAAPHAAAGVSTFDLPGSPSHPLNTQPVVVLTELPSAGTDEGRGMVEIVHKMAPRARLAFASGSLGEVQFGNSIRALAAVPGFTLPNQAGFKADVIVDDISYGGEPMFGESIIGNAIDEVAALGVSYFSSAGNNIGINAYESPLRIVSNGTGLTAAAGNTALAGTNIDLTGVPAALYAGGFHNFNPVSGQLDVAQLTNMPVFASSSSPGSTEMQWDDPYDQRDLVLNQPPIYSVAGTISNAVPTITYDQTSTPALPVFTAGTPYVIQVTATSGDFDAIVSIFDAGNNLIVSQDTGTDETVQFYPPVSGQYHITIGRYLTTAGNFTLVINTGNGTAGVTTDLNLLAFRVDTGAYIPTSSLTSNNVANNRPVELGQIVSPTGQTQIQFVIARSNTPGPLAVRPTRVRWSTRGNGAAGIGPAEYFSYNAVTTKGHATAKGCNGTAAFSVFRPNTPEPFTSPGPATILFDKNANRLATPEIREVPRVAAADAANTSSFSGDSTSDLDTSPNFSGTSAAAPHAAAIAALVLQSRGGSGSVTPADMTKILQRAAFPHDLDPSAASGAAQTINGAGVTITINSDNDSNSLTGQNDPTSIKVTFLGPGSLASLTFNPAGTATEGGNVTGGNSGYFDNTPGAGQITYFENDFQGLAFLPATKGFTLGTLVGLVPADVSGPSNLTPFNGFSNLAPAPANGTSQFRTMTIGFPTGQFTDSKSMTFTVGRGAQHSSTTGNGVAIGPGTVTLNPLADLFGGGVFLPRGTVITDGMTFSGTTTGGATFTGTIKNQIGAGYSRVDGYGFINAPAAMDLIFKNGFQ
ncbi:MAG: hypothetical protein ABI411_02390 [Tahibacter sp.]